MFLFSTRIPHSGQMLELLKILSSTSGHWLSVSIGSLTFFSLISSTLSLFLTGVSGQDISSGDAGWSEDTLEDGGGKRLASSSKGGESISSNDDGVESAWS